MVEAAQRGFLRLHQALYERSGGRIGTRLGPGVECLLLRTTGARSGLARTSALVYATDAGRWVVVASNGGDDRAPGWLHNVQAHPEVEVQIGRVTERATATEITPGDPEYPHLWKLANQVNRGRYDAYQAKTARPISLVTLTPTS
jgi:deazaflavin-dependent oxidoreductase (nitroreductase family)